MKGSFVIASLVVTLFGVLILLDSKKEGSWGMCINQLNYLPFIGLRICWMTWMGPLSSARYTCIVDTIRSKFWWMI